MDKLGKLFFHENYTRCCINQIFSPFRSKHQFNHCCLNDSIYKLPLVLYSLRFKDGIHGIAQGAVFIVNVQVSDWLFWIMGNRGEMSVIQRPTLLKRKPSIERGNHVVCCLHFVNCIFQLEMFMWFFLKCPCCLCS